MNEYRLREIKARANHATPGSWPAQVRVDGFGEYAAGPFHATSDRLRAYFDARFIADAREDVLRLLAEVERLRGVLKRIESLVWYEPDDDDDLVEAVRAMARERDEARRDLCALLAVIHRDGGHHTGEFGVSQSVADAHATWAVVVRERDEARAERDHERTVANEQLARAHDAVRERDEARAEVERLRAALAQAQRADE